MRRTLVAAVLLCACAVLDADVRVLTHIDTVQVDGWYVNGWAFDCATGTQPPEVTVGFWSLDGAGWWFPPEIGVVRNVWRPDVQAAFVGACPLLRDDTGYWLYTSWPPSGQWRVYVAWAAADGAQAVDSRDVTIP